MLYRNKYLILLLAVAVWVGGCKKYLDINQDPNGVNDPSASSLLAAITHSTGMNVFRVANLESHYVQYLAAPSAGNDNDIYNQVNTSSTWNNLYYTMNDLWVLRHKAVAEQLPAYEGVSEILTAFNLNMVLNVWGDAPYSQAFSGEHLNPVFDAQKDLYDSCLQLLNQGIDRLESVSGNSEFSINGTSDFIHGGHIDRWIKTAYGLKANLLNLVSKTSQYDPQKVLNALDKAYTSNNGDAELSDFDNGNPWYSIAFDNANLNLGGWLSANFVNALNGTTYGVFDPRLPLITDTTEDGAYRGTPNGKGYQGTSNTDDYQCYLDVDKWYSSSSSPVALQTYSELEFTKAEAAYRKKDKETAYRSYLEGIKANMTKMGVDQDSITIYISDPAVAVGENNITLELIMKEKYAACFLMPVTWNDMRRTDYDYKDLALPAQAALPDFIRRVNYPDDEVSRNGHNVPKGLKMDDRLWWDQ